MPGLVHPLERVRETPAALPPLRARGRGKSDLHSFRPYPPPGKPHGIRHDCRGRFYPFDFEKLIVIGNAPVPIHRPDDFPCRIHDIDVLRSE